MAVHDIWTHKKFRKKARRGVNNMVHSDSLERAEGEALQARLGHCLHTHRLDWLPRRVSVCVSRIKNRRPSKGCLSCRFRFSQPEKGVLKTQTRTQLTHLSRGLRRRRGARRLPCHRPRPAPDRGHGLGESPAAQTREAQNLSNAHGLARQLPSVWTLVCVVFNRTQEI